MTLDDYQHFAKRTAVYEHHMYPVVSLMVEAAEFADLFVKPELRGDQGYPNTKDIISEAGDVLWNLAVALSDMNISLDRVAEANIEKLQSRLERGVLQGNGGDR